MPTENLNELDEALRHLSLVPPAERGDAWHAYMNAILEKRKNTIAPTFSNREKRIIIAPEKPVGE